jgi:hypothetical protein
MKRSVFLSTFLFAAVLSPITLQPYTCGPPPAEARLAVLELRVGSFAGENTIEGFNPNVFSYEARFPESESVGVLWVKTNHPSTSVDVEYDGLPVQLVGQSVAELDVPLGSSELTIHVARPGVVPDAKTYFVHIQRVPVFACTEQGIREAIAYGGGPNYFDCDGPTVVPTVDEIVINKDVILDGEGDMIVDAGGDGGGTGGAGGAGLMAGEVAPQANGPHRVFYVPEGVTAELIGFTVAGGSTPDEGGGILNGGALRLTSSEVTGNRADIGGGVRNRETGTLIVTGSTVSQNTALRFAGGIHNRGQMEVVDSVISMNEAGQGSAGISNWPEVAIMTLTRTTVSGNVSALTGGGIGNSGLATLDQAIVSGNETGEQGGGIYNRGTLTASDSTIESNSSGSDGGGLYNFEGALTLIGTTVAGNTAVNSGGGIESYSGSTDLVGSTVSGNTATFGIGGGIENTDQASLSLTNSAVTGNTAVNQWGGGIANVGWFTLSDSTISGNVADRGGGVSNSGQATLTNNTVSSNSAVGWDGGGILNLETGTLTVVGGTVSDNTAVFGAGIRNWNQAHVTDVTVSNNVATRAGGGVSNRLGGATMTMSGSTVVGNVAQDGASGGIGNSGNITVINTTLSENTATTDGGGMVNFTGGTADLSEMTFSLNSASTGGGGISNRPDANMTLTGVTVHGNTSEVEGAGGVANAGTMTMRKSIVSSNTAPEGGGGILNTETGALTLMTTTVTGNTTGTWSGGIRNLGAMDIMDTTVSNNTAQGGAGISNRPGAWMALTNSTVSGNEGGSVSNWSTLILASVTVSGDGIFNDGGWLTARNTIVDGQCTGSLLVDSLGGNIESPGNTCFTPHPADQVFVTPEQLNLGPLQDNGGPTWTHALLPGSFAIDSVVECVNPWGFPLFVDQRGASRPHGPACDAGSFELGGVLLPQDQCVNDADRNTYESLVYINSDGYLVTCISAAAEMATDCIFGSAQSSPPIVGCPAQAAAVIACYPSCPPETFEAFGDCVASCTTEVTGLSAECAGCYGALAECAAQVCLVECAGDPDSPECDLCRSQSRCNMIYDACSGLPGSTDCSAVPDLCEGVDCDDQNECTEDLCNGADGSCEHTPLHCDDQNECTTNGCNPAIGCEYTTVANGTPCAGGTCQAGVCTWTGYAQDFESLDQMSPTALSDDGWLISDTVFDDGGAFKFDYGPFDAPNLVGAFCDIDVGQGGSPQGDQQLVVYSDYGCCQPSSGHFPLGSGTDQVQSSVFQEPYPNNPGELIPAAAIGKTLVFSFDAKRGNINSPTDPSGKCDPLSPDYTTNPPCDSTALAYIQTLDPNAGFNRTNFVELDMTSLPFDWARYQISLDLTDPALEGQVLQFGFRTIANAFEPSGVFYDNIVVVQQSGTGGTGGTGGSGGVGGVGGG